MKPNPAELQQMKRSMYEKQLESKAQKTTDKVIYIKESFVNKSTFETKIKDLENKNSSLIAELDNIKKENSLLSHNLDQLTLKFNILLSRQEKSQHKTEENNIIDHGDVLEYQGIFISKERSKDGNYAIYDKDLNSIDVISFHDKLKAMQTNSHEIDKSLELLKQNYKQFRS